MTSLKRTSCRPAGFRNVLYRLVSAYTDIAIHGPGLFCMTVHQYGLFKFSTGNVSRPTTPTASRSRAAIFGLDVISRNLFGARPGSGMGDFFAGSMNGHRRARTADSRNSTLTGSVSTAGSSIGRFSHTSATTAATSVDDDSMHAGSFSKSTSGRARSLSRGAKKLVKRAKSPFNTEPTSEPESPARPKDKGKGSYSRRRSMSTGQADVFEADSDWETDDRHSRSRRMVPMDESERDLTMRLELARRNSQNQHGKEVIHAGMEAPSEETIYEGMLLILRKLFKVVDIAFQTNRLHLFVRALECQRCRGHCPKFHSKLKAFGRARLHSVHHHLYQAALAAPTRGMEGRCRAIHPTAQINVLSALVVSLLSLQRAPHNSLQVCRLLRLTSRLHL